MVKTMRLILIICLTLESFAIEMKRNVSIENLTSVDSNQAASSIHVPTKIELFNPNFGTSKPQGVRVIPIHEEAPPIASSSAYQRVETMKYTPLLSALLLNSLLKLGRYQNVAVGRNSLEHEPTNPFVELLLSHYGKYLPRFAKSPYGFYSYTASNNLHNNKPFGTYKIVYEH